MTALRRLVYWKCSSNWLWTLNWRQ